ncbi:hypothetical protein I316_03777 [Kwoniella heveanensis BCC8398]|uniref:Transglutaminase-like domain-containing protein n=1 Tax=Kwoniella heveanensis BCC8398 TaxID=1296120 RepID=A0A1B9GUK7_9TREE|nr:hypothetical protein I316_03777 [Kwoniella heveanensis BCC8398]
MPPLPALNPDMSGDFTKHQHLINFIASLLAVGRISSIPRSYAPSPREVRSLLDAWLIIERNYPDQVARYVIDRGRNVPNQDMERTIQNLKSHSLTLKVDPNTNVTEYEIRSVLPDLSFATASLLSNLPFKPFGPVDAEVLALARWFKSSYMRWIDPIPCPTCGGPTFGAGSSQPMSHERLDGAGRVELHNCRDPACGGQRRFARYGKIRALLRSREGRCGEWAQLFYVFLRVKGIEARYIWNSEDHVWCEYWSPTLQHWVHVDSCEAATNKPLLYARGWGKKQAYCLAFGPYGAEDVTRAYVDDYNGACRGRRRARGWKEIDLRRALYAHTITLRLQLAPPERARLEAMDQMQTLWTADEAGRFAEAERMELGGRESGPEDWRKMRDEMGAQKVEKPKYTVRSTLQSSGGSLHLLGSARLNDGCIVLTSGSSQTSAVYCRTPIRRTDNLHIHCRFRLSAPPGAGEADGIALIFARERGLGLGGYGMGYDGVGGNGDFAIEVDTYRTQDYADDPPTPHISLQSPPKAHHRHSIACTKAGSIPHLSNGRTYDLEVFYEGSSTEQRTVKAYLGVPGEGWIEVINVPLPASGNDIEDHEWFVGVSGACGGLWQKQEVLNLKIDLIDLDRTGAYDDPPADAKAETSGAEAQAIEVEKDDLA